MREQQLREFVKTLHRRRLHKAADELAALLASTGQDDLSQPCPLCGVPVEREHSFALLESGGKTFGGRKGYWHCWKNANGSAGELADAEPPAQPEERGK